MKTQPENNARATTGEVGSSRTQAGGAVDRTTARAGQRSDLPLFPEIARRRDFPLALCIDGTWTVTVPEPVY
jgi:hypothetical protein